MRRVSRQLPIWRTAATAFATNVPVRASLAWRRVATHGARRLVSSGRGVPHSDAVTVTPARALREAQATAGKRASGGRRRGRGHGRRRATGRRWKSTSTPTKGGRKGEGDGACANDAAGDAAGAGRAGTNAGTGTGGGGGASSGSTGAGTGTGTGAGTGAGSTSAGAGAGSGSGAGTGTGPKYVNVAGERMATAVLSAEDMVMTKLHIANRNKFRAAVAGATTAAVVTVITFWNDITSWFAKETTKVTSDVMNDEEFQQSVQTLAKRVVDEVLRDPELFAQAKVVVMTLLTSPDTQATLLAVFKDTLRNEQTVGEVQTLAKGVVMGLLADQQTLQQFVRILKLALQDPSTLNTVRDLALWLLKQPTTREGLLFLLHSVLEDPGFRQNVTDGLVSVAHDALDNEGVREHAMKFVQDVLEDPEMQRTGGDALRGIVWAALPKWMGGKTPTGSAMTPNSNNGKLDTAKAHPTKGTKGTKGTNGTNGTKDTNMTTLTGATASTSSGDAGTTPSAAEKKHGDGKSDARRGTNANGSDHDDSAATQAATASTDVTATTPASDVIHSGWREPPKSLTAIPAAAPAYATPPVAPTLQPTT